MKNNISFKLIFLVILTMLVCMVSITCAYAEVKDYKDYTYEDYYAMSQQEQLEFMMKFSDAYTIDEFYDWYDDMLEQKHKADKEKESHGEVTIEQEAINVTKNIKGDLSDLISSASEGDVIQLLQSLSTEYINSTFVAEKIGLTLDLNGEKLVVKDINFLFGSVIDSQTEKGRLKVLNSILLSKDNDNYMPIKNSEGAYQFYKISNEVEWKSKAEGTINFVSRIRGDEYAQAIELMEETILSSAEDFISLKNQYSGIEYEEELEKLMREKLGFSLKLKFSMSSMGNKKVNVYAGGEKWNYDEGEIISFDLADILIGFIDSNGESNYPSVKFSGIEKMKGYFVEATAVWDSETKFALETSENITF